MEFLNENSMKLNNTEKDINSYLKEIYKNEFDFSYNAATTGGASGSPVFNKYGMLIGVHHAGVNATQGFNYGVKAKYIKELLDSPHIK